MYMYSITVEPLIKDPPRRGHNRNNLSTKDTLQSPKCLFPILLIHFEPLKIGKPLYKGQNGWPQHVRCSGVPL